MDKQKYMATNDENIIELKHTPGVCCPEASCVSKRKKYKGCGAECSNCKIYKKYYRNK